MKNTNSVNGKTREIFENEVREYPAYVGLDVHKETIVAAIAREGRGKPESLGTIRNKPKEVAKFVERLCREYEGEVLLYCYEAGPCGYVLHRQLEEMGQECHVVAPSKIPKKPGDKIKTDRRDARKLARQLRSGDLTAVWVPGEEQEAMRDLTRARNDFKIQEKKARQQLSAFMLRHGHSWPGTKSRWTKAHMQWMETRKFPHEWQQIVLQDYIDAVKAAKKRVAGITEEMRRALDYWSMAPVVYSLMALRGIDMVSAMGVLAELGDLTRFDSPTQLMGFLGLVPSIHASGPTKREGAITKTGNSRARRLLVEAAWAYRHPARRTAHLKRKAKNASDEAKEISWKAQKRLCGRYRSLVHSGKNTKQAAVAVARELAGFVWDVARVEMAKFETPAR